MAERTAEQIRRELKKLEDSKHDNLCFCGQGMDEHDEQDDHAPSSLYEVCKADLEAELRTHILPPECHNDTPIDWEVTWRAVTQSCK